MILAKDLAELLKGELRGDGEIALSGLATPERAGPRDLVFMEKTASATSAGCVIHGASLEGAFDCPVIVVKNPKLAFARAAQILNAEAVNHTIHPMALISEEAKLGACSVGAFTSIGAGSLIGDGTVIAEGVRIGTDVKVGENCVIHSNCTIYQKTEIGDNVILHAGTVIGADGFGYVRDAEEHVKFPQIGKVVIEDNVEIGANSCVDRGALGETRIGEGTKIDNLVQIAHNVKIGRRVIIAAMTGVSGSSVIEDDVVIAGQVGIADHVTIKTGAVIGAKSAVFPGKIVRPGVWCGVPVVPLEEYKTQNALLRRLVRKSKTDSEAK